jgi:signal transduction histidine kinase
MKLATKISLILILMLALATISNVVTLLSVHQLGKFMQVMLTENVASVRITEEIKNSLLAQRGYIYLYIFDKGNHNWLRELSTRKPVLADWLVQAGKTAHTSEEYQILDRISNTYRLYDAKQDEIIALNQQGHFEQARAILMQDLNKLYEDLYLLCEKFVTINDRLIDSRIQNADEKVNHVFLVVSISILLTSGLGIALFWFFYRGVLSPLRKMAEDVRVLPGQRDQVLSAESTSDEVREVGFYVHSLMSDVIETRLNLEQSRTQLLTAEKLASLGKLAAQIAHEIRNPLTSLKMRLFSVRKQLGINLQYEDDLKVIADEINRLEGIIHNFLEFSRPPELKLRSYNISLLIDKSLELFGHWFEQKNIEVIRKDELRMPHVIADADQIKQVFINLFRNSVEALDENGKIYITTRQEIDKNQRQIITVRFRDNGPGIPDQIRGRIFEPFFSTKNEGIGLGLCIAAQIMAQHGGRIELESISEPGTQFVVWIPTTKGKNG